MAYITEQEIATYCKIPTVTLQDLELATAIINSYKTRSFNVETYTEMAKLKKRNGMYFMQSFSGKLLHYPRVEIKNIITQVPSPFGGLQDVSYPTDSILFDDDTSLYFTFIPVNSATPIPFTPPLPKFIRVTYTSGFEAIPEQIKYICGAIADAVNRNGGFTNYKSRTDFDMSLTFSNEGILTSELKALIDGVDMM